MGDFEIIFYEELDGSVPVEAFLESLDVKTAAKIYRVLLLLEMKGNDLREPYSKHIDDGIFEVRVNQRGGAARILYFFVVGKKVVLTNGFVKKSRKTPKREIDIAKRRRAMYLKGIDEHEQNI